VFSDQQLNGLEKRFESQRYLSTPERVELAAQLSLSETQVRYLRYLSMTETISLADLWLIQYHWLIYDWDNIIGWSMTETISLADLWLRQYHWLIYDWDNTIGWSMTETISLAGLWLRQYHWLVYNWDNIIGWSIMLYRRLSKISIYQRKASYVLKKKIQDICLW
jgi:hypothetical protein